MSDHASGHRQGQGNCNELLKALRALLPGVERKHAKAMCAFHLPTKANFAYVYHAKTKLRLHVWFPSLASQNFLSLRSVQPVKRSKLGTAWADQWAWNFVIDSPEQATDGAEFLLPLAQRNRGSKLTKATGTTVAEEVGAPEASFFEGASVRILVNRYERDANARRACIEHHGAKCHACGFAFGAVYGVEFKNLITVHHLKPLSAVRAKYALDPIKDLVPLCPNCHLLVHQRTPPYSVQEVRSILSSPRR